MLLWAFDSDAGGWHEMAGLGPAQILKADCHGFSAVMLRTEDSDGHECAHDEMLVPRQSQRSRPLGGRQRAARCTARGSSLDTTLR